MKAHLDGERLRVSGAIRLNVALGELRAIEVRGDALTFHIADERIDLALGAKTAAAWAQAIARPKSLLEKLGIKAGQRVCVLGLADSFAAAIAKVTLVPPLSSLRGSFDAIFCAIDAERDLGRVARCRKHLLPAGALWVVSPKGKGAPVHENLVRAAFSDAGLVDTKVVSFSATHTAVRAVIPVAARVRT